MGESVQKIESSWEVLSGDDELDSLNGYYVDTNDYKEDKAENMFDDLSTTLNKLDETPRAKVIFLPKLKLKPQSNLIILQKWEGTVIEIDKSKDECRAHLKDLINPENPDEEITFSIEEISESDIDLVKPGAIFYLYIGYEKRPNGQRLRISEIRFRRLPAWTEKEIEEAKKEAEELGELFGWE